MPYRTVTHGDITLLCFPPYDEVFARLAGSYLDELETRRPEALQDALHGRFPDAVVRSRDALAALGRGDAWYAYRDGRYSPFDDREPWWEVPGVARLEMDADGRYVDASDAALELLGLDRDRLTTMRVGDLTDPATRATLPWVWQLLQDVGELHSTSILATPDGRRIAVEYRMVLDAAGPGRHVSYLRSIPAAGAAPSSTAGAGD